VSFGLLWGLAHFVTWFGCQHVLKADFMQGVQPIPHKRQGWIDFFRGLALVMIFINHIPSNPLSLLTLRSWGLADAAEVFVLLAGMSAALAYGRFFETGQISVGLANVASRIWSLYILHLMLFLALAAICVIAAERWNETSYLELLGFDVFFQAPARFVADVVTLTFLPGYLDILPLYIVLLAFIPLAFMLARRHWLLPLGASFILYLAAQVLPINLPNTRLAREWFFNPFAWQLLLVIGFTIGRWLALTPEPRMPGNERARLALTLAACVVVVLAFLIGAPWREFSGWENVVLINPGIFGTISKTNLHPARVVDILAKLWLVLLVVRAASPFLLLWPARILCAMGRHSLEVFVLATLLSVLGGIVLTIQQFDMVWVISINLSGILAMGMFALLIEWRRRSMAALSRPALSASQPSGLDAHPAVSSLAVPAKR
jgi:hypothetical protein